MRILAPLLFFVGLHVRVFDIVVFAECLVINFYFLKLEGSQLHATG